VEREGARRGFASDNQASAHPDALAAIAAANAGHAPAYGDDPWTAKAEAAFRSHFGTSARAFPVFNGTGANSTALVSLLRPWEAVVCSECAHIDTDECGAPEHFTGSKLLPVAAPDGRVTPAGVADRLRGIGVEHHSQPRALSLTEATEYGTVYGPARVRELADLAHEAGLFVHMDGARLANAAAALDLPMRALTTDAGVDVLSFGGTKNGLVMGEAVVFLSDRVSRAADAFKYARKNGGQLASKMRYVSAQLSALLDGDLWLRNARHANAMAARLEKGARGVPWVEIVAPVEANEIFARIPGRVVGDLQDAYPFYVWDERGRSLEDHTVVVRWVASWDTTEDDVDGLVAALADA